LVAPGSRGLSYLFRRDGRGASEFARTVAVKAERWRRRDRWRRSLRRRLPSVDQIPLDRPIFVLGMQGGGTTLVSRCLLRHPSAVSMSGNSGYWVATDEIGFVRNRMDALPRTLWSSAHRDDLAHPLFGTEHASVYACDELLPSYRNVAADATPEDSARFKRVLREHIAVYAHDPAHARFVDKTHTYTVKVGYIDRLLEGHEPHFVLVIRNPYTMCFRAARRKPPSWSRAIEYPDQIRIFAQNWENSIRLALEDGGAIGGRFVAVRFEDFVERPEHVIRAVCSSVDLAFDPELVPRAGHEFPFATLPTDRKWFPLESDEWRGQVGELEAEIVEERCGELAAALGYGRLEDTAPAQPGVVNAA
jgi:Sulfotransferase family